MFPMPAAWRRRWPRWRGGSAGSTRNAGIAVFAPLLAPYDPNAQTLLARLRPPVGFDRAIAAHPLGTDQLGRDICEIPLPPPSVPGLRLYDALLAMVRAAASGPLSPS